ncbi:hypothetical protein JHK85_002682 [Glycine max]|nr:hypothetical protein JHK85_002682 [Glycine max]
MGTQPQQTFWEEEDEEMQGRGTTISGQSMSTSRSLGSPSSRSEQTMATPASDSTFLRLNHLDIHGDDAGSQGAVACLCSLGCHYFCGGHDDIFPYWLYFPSIGCPVCEKVESKGRTTYNEVADELVAEFADPINGVSTPDQQQYDEKNIRRRVYDALNVLMAMDIISKDKKEIQWKGLPRTSLSDMEELKSERLGLRNRIEKKAAYLQELEEQYIGLQKLIQRNEQLYSSGNAPNGGVSLPFILVQTRPHATVEVEISEDMQLVHFDFNSTPFELHDDNYVLKAMKLCEGSHNDNTTDNPTDGGEGSSIYAQVPTSVSNPPNRPPSSPPLPGILKARVKNEH